MAAGILVSDTEVGPFARSLGQGAKVAAPGGAVSMNAEGVFTLAAGATKPFKSAETTGTGSAQDIAHGLGVVPSCVAIIPTDLSASTVGQYVAVEGVHDATNVKVTVTTGKKFIVLAWK